MDHSNTPETPERGKAREAKADLHLERLKVAAERGGSGINLAGMARAEIRRRLEIGRVEE